ncbi:MAG: translation elongation factor-like protein [Patescibacteria group bacterium]
MKKVGKITHYYGKIGVATMKLASSLKMGDRVKFEGHGADFEQEITSMQIQHEGVDKAKKGDEIGLKVSEAVKEGTDVLLV